jgi:hypothetical protein
MMVDIFDLMGVVHNSLFNVSVISAGKNAKFVGISLILCTSSIHFLRYLARLFEMRQKVD